MQINILIYFKMQSPKAKSEQNWSSEADQNKCIYKHKDYLSIHVSVYFNGDYHATSTENEVKRHFGYVNGVFKIDGGTNLRKLFLLWEEDVLLQNIALPSAMRRNIELKIERERELTPIEKFIRRNQNKKQGFFKFDARTAKRKKSSSKLRTQPKRSRL